MKKLGLGTLFTAAIFSLFLVLMSPAQLLGQNKKEEAPEEVDYIGIAALMIRDGNYDRAKSALESVDLNAEGVDKAQYYTLKGLIEIRESRYREAIGSFENAIKNGQTNPVLQVYLAQAYFGVEDFRKAIEAIDKVQNLNQYPELIGVRSRCHWELGEKEEAYRIIDRAVTTFPGKTQFRQQRIFYLIELGLSREAAEQSREYLEMAGEAPGAYLTIGEALRRGGEKELAIRVYEMAKLLFPDNERIRLALAYAYAFNDQPVVAARIVEQAAAYNGELYFEAADLYRRAKNYDRAIYMNSLVADQKQKAEQRFNLLIEMGRYEEALALESRLQRLGALTEDGMKYAMAYVHFNAQHYDRASEYLNQVTSSEFFRSATQLRKAIELMRADTLRYF